MEDEQITSLEIVHLTEKFIKAVKDSDMKTVSEIADDHLKIECRHFAGSFIEDFDKDGMNKIHILSRVFETMPHVYLGQDKARVVYERKSHFHLQNSDFQNGFIRETYSYKKFENIWKLTYIKTEIRRFSGYQVKESLFGLMECLILKVVRRNG